MLDSVWVQLQAGLVVAIRMVRPETAIGAVGDTTQLADWALTPEWGPRPGPRLLRLVRKAVQSWPHPPFCNSPPIFRHAVCTIAH
ncbi:hypothetical protein BKG76_16585 [Mycobacteroides franklinii]|uniref:Uncharacterized protein n=1 Tax=Mycobacteroides franklinii TaxID=948102 RepID=A0A1S1L9T7_9MYCO|nr:hypothetical protein BKG76_16585 [Mycobacteroides franklinii]